MQLDIDRVDAALSPLDLGRVVSLTEMAGGSAPAFRVDLSSGKAVVLKVYFDERANLPEREAFAATLLQGAAIPATQYLLIDETRSRFQFRFAVTNYLPGAAGGTFRNHPGRADLYRQMGQLLGSLHSVAMPAYGAFGARGILDPVSSNAAFIRRLADHAFERFVALGGDPELAFRLGRIVDERFDAIVIPGKGPVFAHDDLHPDNVLALEDGEGKLILTGLIDLGNARAADPVFDLAKCLFISEHGAPGCARHILAGYGTIDHPAPDDAIRYYTLLHRVVMWWWLRHTGVIATPETPSDLMDALRQTAELWA